MQGYIERAFARRDGVVRAPRAQAPTASCAGCAMTLFPDRESGGRVGGAFAVMNDIEDDVRIRDALRRRKSQLRLFADNIPGPIAYLDRALHYTFVNQAFANWVCRPQDEIYGKTPHEVLPRDVATFLRPILKRAQDGEHVEYERVGKNAGRRARAGCTAASRPTSMPRARCAGLYCTEYDIHDLKSTEQALAAREEQLRLFTDNIPEPVVYLDADRQLRVRQRGVPAAQRPRRATQVIGKPSEEVSASRRREAAGAVPRSRVRRRDGDLRARDRSTLKGRMRWIRGRIVPDHAFDGTIKGVYVVGHDITDLKEAQDALAARESQLRAIMDGVPAPVAYIDRDERCHYVNRTFLQYFGLTAEQVARDAPARRRRPRHLPERAGDARARAARASRPRSTGWCRARTAFAAG